MQHVAIMSYSTYNMFMKWKVVFYHREDGFCPVSAFIESLDVKMRAKVYRNIKILKQFGPNLKEPLSKYLSNGLFELRTTYSSNTTRIMYYFQFSNLIVLTNGFVKKTQKTPKKEIDLALKYKKDYEGRIE